MSAGNDRQLPPGLERLRDLAGDLRWTWSHTADALWRTIDPTSWERSENPWSILQYVRHERLDALAADPEFVAELGRLDDARQRYLREPGWFGETFTEQPLRQVAYFCMEFGLAEALPLYAGGLGVLAGDFLKAASDLGVPVVGVGLLYQEGFFRQTIDDAGRQQVAYPYNDPTSLPIAPVLTSGGDWLRVLLALPGRELHVRVWQARVGRVTLYLLDTNDPLNSPIDRGITGKLYQGSQLVRFLQQVVLGVGGWRALVAQGIDPDICHVNEGHAAFAILERARDYMRRTGLSFWEALWVTRAGNVFTTHTPVDEAFTRFDDATLASFRPYFREYVASLGIALDDLLALGRASPADLAEPFRPAYLAIRGSAWVNGVSRLHGEVSRRILAGLYPRWPLVEIPIGHITNGVHVPSWDSPSMDALWESACGKERWRGALEVTASIRSLSDRQLWEARGKDRERLVHVVRTRLARQLGIRGAEPTSIEQAAHVFDANTLTLGFARRFVGYKRAALLLHDPDRLERLLTSPDRPVQLVVAGKAHPDDARGAALITRWIEFAGRPAVRHRVVFLEDYDITLAEELVRGVDVWLNTPLVSWEACGTSGMKVLANGGLNASTLGGWWAEAYDSRVGWYIPDGDEPLASACLYDLLEREVVPEFYTRDSTGSPTPWIERIRASMSALAPRFSANRMVYDYVTNAYLPAARRLRLRECDNGQLGRELLAWSRRIEHDWHGIHFGQLEASDTDGRRALSVAVYLGAVAPVDVAVELYADPSDADVPERLTMQRTSDLPGTVNGGLYRADIASTRPLSDYTPRVIPRHPHACIPAEASAIAWYR